MSLHFPYNILLLDIKPEWLRIILCNTVYSSSLLWLKFLLYSLVLQLIIYQVPNRRRREPLAPYLKRIPYFIAVHAMLYHTQQARRDSIVILLALSNAHKYNRLISKSMTENLKHYREIELAARVLQKRSSTYFW